MTKYTLQHIVLVCIRTRSSFDLIFFYPEFVSALKLGIFVDNELNNNISRPDNLEYQKKDARVHITMQIGQFWNSCQDFASDGFAGQM